MAKNTAVARNHVNAPHNQVFNVRAKPNAKKRNSWWSASSATYWRSRKDKTRKESE